MTRSSTRFLLTFLMYLGVVIFLYPYVTGHLTNGILMLIGGAVLTVASGLLRCFLTEGDCAKHPISKPAP